MNYTTKSFESDHIDTIKSFFLYPFKYEYFIWNAITN